jgi:hypothetical protein
MRNLVHFLGISIKNEKGRDNMINSHFSIPGTKKYMLESTYWLNKLETEETLLMDKKAIGDFNKKTLIKVNTMQNIREHKESLTREELQHILGTYTIPKDIRYDLKGREIKQDFYIALIQNTNLEEIQDINTVKFGISVKNTRLRSFPTEEGTFEDSGSIEFDLFQETECSALDAVAILHESSDRNWFYIQMHNYNGWVKACDIAIAKNKEEIFNYLDTDHFLMVSGNKIGTQFNHYDERVSRKDFYMGTKIPLEIEPPSNIGNQASLLHHVVKIPLRDNEGFLEFRNALISHKEDVTLGYLPYTRTSILNQAFKLLGDRYDWGNKNNGRDCSSFLMCVYKTVGIILPRNGNHQEIGEGLSYAFDKNATLKERIRTFENVKPGAAIFSSGHVMLYIGEDDGDHYMIHDFHSYGRRCEDDTLEKIYINEVAVTSTLLLTSKGNKYIETFSSLLQFE